jgi:hypothetical protein
LSKSTLLRVGGFIGSAAVTAGLVGAAVTGTGAYFSDAKSGTITGTMGSIAIAGSNGSANDLGITFDKMLPGEAQSKTITFQNTGSNNQDVWVVFDQDDLGDGNGTKGLNSLGTYGEVHVKANGTEIFGSANLNDRASTCAPGEGNPACNPLPHMLKLASNVPSQEGGSMEFTFKPGAKFKSYMNMPVLNLDYKLVATQVGISPDNDLNSVVVK